MVHTHNQHLDRTHIDDLAFVPNDKQDAVAAPGALNTECKLYCLSLHTCSTERHVQVLLCTLDNLHLSQLVTHRILTKHAA